MYRKWSTFVLLALATPTLALAQATGKLQGRVVDVGDSNEPMPGVTVTIEGTALGATTDVDGNYVILGIPVGTYSVRAEFIGYNPVLVRNVEINSGSTRQLDFSLSESATAEEQIVTAERPIIQNDAITTGRAVTAQTLENLPVRGVNAVAAVQAGVVDNGSGALNVRGGRSEEVAYYVDGVRVVGNLGVPQQAIQEQELVLGAIPARFGDAMAGVINITTKSGLQDRFFGSAEAITSQFLDPYGYNLGSFSIGGPIVRNRATFFLSTEGTFREDSDPYRGDVLRLPQETFDALQASPQVVIGRKSDGSAVYIPIPGDLASGTSYRQLVARLTADGRIGGNTGVTLSQADAVPVNRAETLVRSDFETASSKRQPSQGLAVAGNMSFRPFGSMTLRLGGNLGRNTAESFSYGRSLYNDNRFVESERTSYRIFSDLRQSFNRSRGFYQMNLSYSDDKGGSWPGGFGNDVRNTLFYGDVDGRNADGSETMAFALNEVARRYYVLSDTTYRLANNDGVFPGSVYSLFNLPGAAPLAFSKFRTQQTRFTASITNQVGVHQLEAGAEYETSTRRQYITNTATAYSRYYKDGTVEVGANLGVDRYEDLPFSIVRTTLGNWYGYDYLGLNEVNSGTAPSQFGNNVTFANPANGNVAPWQPYYYAGYIQDKIEYRDLVIQVGFRADAFNTNAKVLFDPYALSPIVRVSDLANATVPGNVESDYAVYFANGNATAAGGKYSGTILGYRDLNGVYYNAAGTRTTLAELSVGQNPQVAASAADYDSIFRDSETEWTLMPRVGVSFPVTDQALFFASYNVTSQRPSEAAFFPAEFYQQVRTGRIANPNLKPERTTQYEIGFRQRLGDRAALQLSGFYKTQTNKIGVRSLTNAYPATSNGYSSFFNIDFTTTKGATVEFDLRRTRGLMLNANYTLSFAQGTGSDAQTSGTIAWRGNYYPDFLVPTDFDRRHSLNVNADYRFGRGEGPMWGGKRWLENTGLNVLAVVQSGLPYTKLSSPTEFPVYASFTENVVGGLNGAYTPWTNRIDLRLDRNFAVGDRVALNLFLNMQNVLNTRNVLGVFRNTGQADNDGFLDGKAGAEVASGAVSPESFRFHYGYATANPLGAGSSFSAGAARGIGAPRQTRLGVRLTF